MTEETDDAQIQENATGITNGIYTFKNLYVIFVNVRALTIIKHQMNSMEDEKNMSAKKKMQFYCILLATAVLLISLAGCAVNPQDSQNNKNQSTQTAGSTNQTAAETQEKKEPITFRYWTPLNTQAVRILENFSENEVYKKKMEITGYKIEFIHPIVGQEQEQYRLMIASDDLPDMIQHYRVNYPTGPDQAIKDGVYLRLNELIEEHAPNYKRLREENPEVKKRTITDEGNIWSFMTVNTVEESNWRGPILRKDFLDKAGLDIPETIDEWYTVLKAFKEMGVECPLLYYKNAKMPESQFSSAYGAAESFFIDENGKVRYGPAEPGYKEHLETMSRWYKEGLIDKDFPTRDQNALDALVVSDKAGAWVGPPDTSINPYLIMKKDDPNFALVGAPYPVLKKGDRIRISQKNGFAGNHDVAITTSCKYPVDAVKFMDFNYSEEGYMLFNYGIEGLTYTMVNGEPQFTEFMLNDKDNLGFDVMSWKYRLFQGPYLRYYLATAPYTPTVIQAREAWASAGNEGNMPPVTRTTDEAKRYSALYTDINTYKEEMVMKFFLGIEPLSKFDEYVEQLEKRGLSELIKLEQAAVDRYNAR